MNLAIRARHTTQGDIDDQIGMSLTTMFKSVRKMWRKFSADHVVFCFEGSSWRKDIYEPYKKNRKIRQAKKTERERADDEIFLEAIGDLQTYLIDKTNATTLRSAKAEADDMIYAFIESHPNDKHVIISTDSDFEQLLKPNVELYNGVSDTLMTHVGVFDGTTGAAIIDKKTQLPKTVDPEYSLFKKCIRGDTADNIFSAYPGVREKGTKKKVGIKEAFEDMGAGGFEWNAFMLQRWTDVDGVERVVKDDYNRNKLLIDLTMVPKDLKDGMVDSLNEALEVEPVRDVGFNFLKYCVLWDLTKLSDYPDDFARILNTKYVGSDA